MLLSRKDIDIYYLKKKKEKGNHALKIPRII